MKKLISLTILLAAMSASAITATKAYVDKRDAATYAAATNAVAEQYLPKFIGIDWDSRYYVDVDPDRYGIKIWTDRWPNSVTRYGHHSALISGEQNLLVGGDNPGYHIGTSDGSPNTGSFGYINGYYVYRADGKFSTVRFPKPPGETNTLALASDVAAVSNLVGSASADATEALNLASAVSTVVIGEDCQLVSTNYNSATKLPSLFLRFKIPNEETGSNEWHVVWNEMTRWNWFLDDYLPTNYYTKTEIAAELDQKADRAWGYYDSTTGNYAPEGFTWISSPSIAIAGGLAYQRVVTTEGAIWVLESNGMTTITGGETNGFFRISDDKGNAIFEITKGTEVLAGATAGALRTATVDGKTHLYITYNVESSSNPTIEVCTDLKAADWVAESEDACKANVVWSGSSGAFVAEVWGKQAYNSLFVRASYKKGQKDMIKNSAPVGFSEIVIDGVTYKVSVETMNGKKVMVLE